MTEHARMSPEAAFLDYAQMLQRWTDMALGVRDRLIAGGVDPQAADHASTQILVVLISGFAARSR